MVALHAFWPVCGAASTAASGSLGPHSNPQGWAPLCNQSFGLKHSCFASRRLVLSTVTQFQGIQTMLMRPFLLQKRQACVMWWQQRLPVLSEHVSMPLNSFNQVNVATYNVMQPLVLVTLGKCFIFLLLAGIQDFVFF